MNLNQSVQEFLALQQQLGGAFEERSLNQRVYRSVVRASDRQNSPTHITRLILVGSQFTIALHYHKNITEVITVVHVSSNAYGHISVSANEHVSLRENVGKQFTFAPNHAHRIIVVSGYIILQVEIHGEFSSEDVYSHV
jgi:hypothetical protein